jgi:hypothetical protein
MHLAQKKSAMHTRRFGRKLKLPSTVAIKHAILRMMTSLLTAVAPRPTTGVLMQISHFINRHGINLPKCAACGVSMWLARVEPDRPDHDKCTFECSVCENVVVASIKYR